MKHSRLLANLLAAVLCFLFVYATSSDGQEAAESAPAPLSYVGAGWDELDYEVRAGLWRELLSQPRINQLAGSAMAYVGEEDFLPTEIMGPVKLEPEGEEFLLAFREGKTYVLDLPFTGAPVFPGLYWTSGSGTRWSVILPEGETANYWVDREL